MSRLCNGTGFHWGMDGAASAVCVPLRRRFLLLLLLLYQSLGLRWLQSAVVACSDVHRKWNKRLPVSGGLVRTRLSGRLPYGLFYGLSFGLFAGGLGCTGSRFAERLPCTGCFREEDAERRLPRFGVIWVRSSAVNSKRSYRLNTGGEKRESSISSFGSGNGFSMVAVTGSTGLVAVAGSVGAGSDADLFSGSGALVCSGTVFGAGACSTSLVCSGVSFNRVGWVCCTCALRCCSSNGRNC